MSKLEEQANSFVKVGKTHSGTYDIREACGDFLWGGLVYTYDLELKGMKR
jgi:hypothetical protein